MVQIASLIPTLTLAILASANPLVKRDCPGTQPWSAHLSGTWSGAPINGQTSGKYCNAELADTPWPQGAKTATFTVLDATTCKEVVTFGNYIGITKFAPEYNVTYDYRSTAATISAPDDVDSGNWQPIETTTSDYTGDCDKFLPNHVGKLSFTY
ncbi:hypothetical protein BT69DRAFT_1279463 [Atractiella rhizophila]|nr:hypothetical protein BT69DRAFT_1279463 [Atractiella rhizophila]